MKKYLSLFLFCLVISSVYSQTSDLTNSPNIISLNFSQTYSKFKFTDSEGKIDPNMNFVIHAAYALDYYKIFNFGLYFKPEIGYKNYGSNSSVNDVNLDWSLHYFDGSLGIGYILNGKENKLKPFIGASGYISTLIKAEQTIGPNAYDMIKQNAINKIDYGLYGHAGLNISLNKAISIFLEYNIQR